MSEMHVNETPVDRREETIVTRQPGYVATEQVVHDAAAERRLGLFQVTRVIWTVLGILEIFMGLRVVLRLIGANPNSGFAQFIYGITAPFLLPFAGLTASPSAGAAATAPTLEVPTLIAMAVYALFFWIIVRLVNLAADRPSARIVTRSVREAAPVGTVTQTTQTTQPTVTTETERTSRIVTNQ